MEEEIQISGKVLLWMVEGVEENRCGCSCLRSKPQVIIQHVHMLSFIPQLLHLLSSQSGIMPN